MLQETEKKESLIFFLFSPNGAPYERNSSKNRQIVHLLQTDKKNNPLLLKKKTSWNANIFSPKPKWNVDLYTEDGPQDFLYNPLLISTVVCFRKWPSKNKRPMETLKKKQVFIETLGQFYDLLRCLENYCYHSGFKVKSLSSYYCGFLWLIIIISLFYFWLSRGQSFDSLRAGQGWSPVKCNPLSFRNFLN